MTFTFAHLNQLLGGANDPRKLFSLCREEGEQLIVEHEAEFIEEFNRIRAENLTSRRFGIQPTMAQCEAALVGNDRLIWRVLGYPIEDERFYSDRKVICDECEDRVCAMCWRTEIYRWIRSQRCPLSEW